jgi:hypothetical protein
VALDDLAEFDVRAALGLLNKKLKKAQKSYTLYICGGAALFLMGYEKRATADIDVLIEDFDRSLSELAAEVAEELSLSEGWLNNQVYPLVKSLGEGWKDGATELYSASNLTVLGIQRQLLINTKLRAAVNRQKGDDKDLAWLKPSGPELEEAKAYVLSSGFLGPEEVVDAEIEFLLGGGA